METRLLLNSRVIHPLFLVSAGGCRCELPCLLKSEFQRLRRFLFAFAFCVSVSEHRTLDMLGKPDAELHPMPYLHTLMCGLLFS